jgi:hypothetical protein
LKSKFQNKLKKTKSKINPNFLFCFEIFSFEIYLAFELGPLNFYCRHLFDLWAWAFELLTLPFALCPFTFHLLFVILSTVGLLDCCTLCSLLIASWPSGRPAFQRSLKATLTI